MLLIETLSLATLLVIVIANVLEDELAVVYPNLEGPSDNVEMQNATSTAFQEDFLSVLISSVEASTCQVATASLSPQPNKQHMEEFDYSFLQQDMGSWVPLDTLNGFTEPQEELMAPQPITVLPHTNSGGSEGAFGSRASTCNHLSVVASLTLLLLQPVTAVPLDTIGGLKW